MSIESELLALKDVEGLIRPETALAWAKSNKKSALFGAIDWDIDRCAARDQLQQVRRLITLNVRFEDSTPRAVSFVSDRVSGGGYRLLDEVIPYEEMYNRLLNEVLAAIDALRAKYDMIKEMRQVWEEADAIRDQQMRKAAQPRKGSRPKPAPPKQKQQPRKRSGRR